MHRSAIHRDQIRRSNGGAGAGGVTSISVNGGPPLTGAISLLSPMAVGAANPIRVDNGNVKTLADAASIVGIDVDLNQSFQVAITAARTFAAPTNSILGAPREGEKITFTIEQDGGSFTPLWTGGAGGYQFANAATPNGITLAQHDALAAATPDGSKYKVGFEWDSGIGQWLCVALAGWWT